MAFEPCNDNHAITEVVFAVVGLVQFTSDDRSSVRGAHSRWEALLPRLQEQGVFNIAFAGPGGADMPPPPIAPLSFARFRADGEMEWHLLLDAQTLVVSCRAYTRWNEVWAVAHDVFASVTEVLASRDQKIQAVGLQYTDVFRWAGDDAYDVRGLLQEGELVPSGIFRRREIWHLDQGWFVDTEEPVPGNVLQRMFIGSTVEDDQPQVRFNTHLRFDLRDTPDIRAAFTEPKPLADGLFGSLHCSAKALLAGFLTEEMAQRIDLHAD